MGRPATNLMFHRLGSLYYARCGRAFPAPENRSPDIAKPRRAGLRIPGKTRRINGVRTRSSDISPDFASPIFGRGRSASGCRRVGLLVAGDVRGIRV